MVKRKDILILLEKGINVTKEETIRQQVLRYLLDVIKVPEEMVVSEDHMAHYDRAQQ